MHLQQLRNRIANCQHIDEQALLADLRSRSNAASLSSNEIVNNAMHLSQEARSFLFRQTGLSHFVQEYDLRSEEGVLLMCLSEALLRIPDSETRAQMVDEILSLGHWDQHLGNSPSLLVNASTWGLYFGARFLQPDTSHIAAPAETFHHMTQRLGKTVAQAAMIQAVKLLADHFVMGTDIHTALNRAEKHSQAPRQTWSFDCLGEAAQTTQDVERYLAAYAEAIEAAGQSQTQDLFSNNSISIKLSALHPRYDSFHHQRVMRELLPRLRDLVVMAMAHHLPITLDAEEAGRLELSLDLFQALWTDPRIDAWPGLGLAVQAYQKRALTVLEWLHALANERQQTIPVRLVKGAYWDSEIKWAQQAGLDYYPVFTRKPATDVNYLVCALYMLQHPQQFYCQFATHNAYSIAFLLQHAQANHFEFQRLHGMGDAIYSALYASKPDAPPCRIYAPVGQHETLLPYLVRRLLENGANSSFVNQLADESLPVQQIVQDPFAQLEQPAATNIPLARDLYQPERQNSQGLDLHDAVELQALQHALEKEYALHWHANPIISGKCQDGKTVTCVNPADTRDVIGTLTATGVDQVDAAFQSCIESIGQWQHTPVEQRATCLDVAADLFEQHRPQLMARIVREGGRTLPDALSEVREAVDFCRYYAAQARRLLAEPNSLPGPTGEENQLYLTGRGVFACISPWNFPLAIFVGQIAAALVSGNAVIAKPAGDTPLTAQLAIELLHQAGIPGQVLQYLPGDSRVLGRPVLTHPQLAGVAFTGSFDTAQYLHRTLAQRDGPILPLIAETGGVNVMFADSSTLPDQLVNDVLQSAFNSAGQRCSALRLLLIQDDIADAVLQRLAGALREWQVGNPAELTTDIGPVINPAAAEKLNRYCQDMGNQAHLVQGIPINKTLDGHFVAPHIFEIDKLDVIPGEVFGPVLHVMRYRKTELVSLIEAVNRLGFGLTMGIHSRLRSTWETVRNSAKVGNLYINRNMIGAVVGSQPFGGEGLSGTGPKAGGPRYLSRFCHERSVSINTAAIGGNADLLRK